MQQSAPVEAGIAVIDLPRMLEFYQQVLSCREERRSDIPAALSAPLGMAAHGYTCVWLVTPNDERIKLMHPTAPPQRLQTPEHLTQRTGIAYLTFYCTDLGPTLDTALQLGATLRSAPELAADTNPVRLCFVEDPEGNVIELVQTSDGARV